MKRIAFALILLLLAVSVHAQMLPFPSSGSSVASSCADSSCSGFLTCQNFETATTGFDNSESWTISQPTGTAVNPVYTTTALRGTQSAALYGATATHTPAQIYTTVTPTASLSGFFRFRMTAEPSGQDPMLYVDDASEVEDELTLSMASGLTGLILGQHNGGDTATCTYAFAINTTYYVWHDYTAGSGSNGAAHVYVGTTTTKPGSPCASITAGHSTLSVSKLFYAEGGYGATFILDQILNRASAIGDVCN